VAERIETLSLLFTDIEGSTNLLRSLGAEYRTLLPSTGVCSAMHSPLTAARSCRAKETLCS
jgi:hypothetical protein